MVKTYTLRITDKDKEILNKIKQKGETPEETMKRLLLALETYDDAMAFIEGLTWWRKL